MLHTITGVCYAQLVWSIWRGHFGIIVKKVRECNHEGMKDRKASFLGVGDSLVEWLLASAKQTW